MQEYLDLPLEQVIAIIDSINLDKAVFFIQLIAQHFKVGIETQPYLSSGVLS